MEMDSQLVNSETTISDGSCAINCLRFPGIRLKHKLTLIQHLSSWLDESNFGCFQRFFHEYIVRRMHVPHGEIYDFRFSIIPSHLFLHASKLFFG